MLPSKGKEETLSTNKNVTYSTSHLTSSLNVGWVPLMNNHMWWLGKGPLPSYSLPCLPLWQTLHTLTGNFVSSQFLSITTTGLDHVLSLCTSHRSSFTTFNIHTLHILNLKMEAARSFASLLATNTTQCHISKDHKLKYCSTSTSLTLNIPRGVLRGPPLVCYGLTSVEINKHKIFYTNNAWITEL